MTTVLARRKRLILLYSVSGLLVTIAATGLVLWLRRPQEAYRPGKALEGVTSRLSRDLPEDHPRVQFSDATASAGIDFRHFEGERSTQLPEDMGSGAAWGDYDNDGLPDLFLVNIAGPLTWDAADRESSSAHNRLFHNEGDGTFTDVSQQAGVGARMIGMGAAWGDWNDDGNLDLVVTGFGEPKLYRNEGNGSFDEVTPESGLDDFTGFWTGTAWGDYDADGDLDLYVCGYVRYEFHSEDRNRGTRQYQAVVPFTLNPSSYPAERNLLFRNDGGGQFEEVAAAVGVENSDGRSLAVSWSDFDEDGRLDLYVANDVSDNVMYRNRGEAGFEDVSHAAWVADYRGAMGIAVGDWDGDTDQDLFVTHWVAQENALYSNMKVAFGGTPVKPGAIRFMDVADMVGVGQIALDFIGWGTFFFDYDNDGRPDLFVANGSTFQREDQPSRLVPMKSSLFWNAGTDRGFFDVTEVSGEALRTARVSRGAASADYDGDGDLDVVLVNHGESVILLRNEGGSENHWLIVEARSREGNRFGVGAKVSVTIGDETQTVQIGSQASYLSQNPYHAHFGLGTAERVERLRVIFPSGVVRELENVSANQRLLVWEQP